MDRMLLIGEGLHLFNPVVGLGIVILFGKLISPPKCVTKLPTTLLRGAVHSPFCGFLTSEIITSIDFYNSLEHSSEIVNSAVGADANEIG